MAGPVTKKTLVARVREAVHRRSFFGKIEKIADRRRHAFNRRAHLARVRVANRREDLDDLKKSGASALEREGAEQVLFAAEHRLIRLLRKREFWRNRYTWAHARHQHWGLVLRHRRDRLRRWIMRHKGFQPYMANGHPWLKLTPEARYAVYLDFRDGNYVTATYEGHPGDGVHTPSSGHYLQNQPDGRARCFDCGASRRGPMARAQLREAQRCPSFLIEMIGPENADEFKNGIRYTLPEGDPLEEMHDNHLHTWIRDGAPT